MTRLAACFLLLTAFSCPVWAQTPPPSLTVVKNQVREAFDQFRRAVLRGDRETVAKMVTGEAVQYGAALLRMAQTWDRQRLAKQSAATQIAVLGLRLDVEPAELETMPPADAFARTYEAGVVDPLVFEEMTLTKIDLVGGREAAKALIGLGDQQTGASIAFALIDGRWHVDPVNVSNEISLSLTIYLKQRGVDEGVYVVDFMDQMYGETFNEQVWRPTKQRPTAGPD